MSCITRVHSNSQLLSIFQPVSIFDQSKIMLVGHIFCTFAVRATFVAKFEYLFYTLIDYSCIVVHRLINEALYSLRVFLVAA